MLRVVVWVIFSRSRKVRKVVFLGKLVFMLLMAEILHQLRLVVFPIIYRVSAPSQVVVWDFSHQQCHHLVDLILFASWLLFLFIQLTMFFFRSFPWAIRTPLLPGSEVALA